MSTWRTLWPGEELRRRGHDVQIDAMDAGYAPDILPAKAIAVVHLTPSIWAVKEWRERVETVCAYADRLIVSLDDDWTRRPEVREGIWDANQG